MAPADLSVTIDCVASRPVASETIRNDMKLGYTMSVSKKIDLFSWKKAKSTIGVQYIYS